MITIKLTDEQYDLIEMAIGIAETYFEEQLDVLKDIAPSWKNSIVKGLEDLYLDVKELRDDFEMGKLEKSYIEKKEEQNDRRNCDLHYDLCDVVVAGANR